MLVRPELCHGTTLDRAALQLELVRGASAMRATLAAAAVVVALVNLRPAVEIFRLAAANVRLAAPGVEGFGLGRVVSLGRGRLGRESCSSRAHAVWQACCTARGACRRDRGKTARSPKRVGAGAAPGSVHVHSDEVS